MVRDSTSSARKNTVLLRQLVCTSALAALVLQTQGEALAAKRKGMALSSKALPPTASQGAAATGAQRPLTLPPGVKLVRVGSAIPGTPELYKFLLPNGLRLMVLPDSRNPLGTLRVKLDGGSNREVKGKTGLAHFFEHMMFRKTLATEEGHYDRTLSGFGGNGNAGTSTDYVVYESSFPGPALEKMLETEAQRFQQLDLKDPYFTTEKGAVISERKLRYENDPSQRANEILHALTESGTSYEWLTIGAKLDVQNMSIEAAQEFYKNYYTPDNAIMTIGGPFKVEEVVAKVVRYFGDWKGKVQQKPVVFPADYLTRNLGKSFVCSEAVTESRMTVVFPSSDASYKASILAWAFSQMLDDHEGGTMQRRLAKKKIATGFAFYKRGGQKINPSMMGVFKLGREQRLDVAEKFWWDSVQEVLKKPFDARMKKLLVKQILVDEAEQAQRMTSLVQNYEWYEYFYGDAFVPAQTASIINALSEADFRAWIRTNITKEKSYKTGIVPTGGWAKPCSEFMTAQKQKP